ncbi:hypothetical protein VPNG_05049 [Cytospora leucostoma]|uniref:GH16 domain-containing protein n=1 Tax=Cytospora leucostoma TaxID=1230097 RepID=A0A423X553_9PEZI|nr:hypothetical protein VPNG_05049 [Cytospora leucostoma]
MASQIWLLMAAFTVAVSAHNADVVKDRDIVNAGSDSGRYRLSDIYNSTNFFSKFDYWESFTHTADYNEVDTTSGFVLYQNFSEAQRLGLIQTVGDVSVIRSDAETVIADPTGYGRKSVKIQSISAYNHGLFIIDFSHLPSLQCGTWPAFWMLGPAWPTNGEIDIYEQWNTYNFNRQSLHTTYNTTIGNCTFNSTSALGMGNYHMTNHLYADNCDVHASDNVGCSTWDYEGPYGSPDGGVYALEWTSSLIQMWSWHPGQVPANVRDGTVPTPNAWGPPGLLLTGSTCDIDRAFKNQSIMINLDFCGTAAGDGAEWTSGCADKTGYNTCARYVAANPQDFKDYWFGVRSIKVYDYS